MNRRSCRKLLFSAEIDIFMPFKQIFYDNDLFFILIIECAYTENKETAALYRRDCRKPPSSEKYNSCIFLIISNSFVTYGCCYPCFSSFMSSLSFIGFLLSIKVVYIKMFIYIFYPSMYQWSVILQARHMGYWVIFE